jgi:hypothetical protein
MAITDRPRATETPEQTGWSRGGFPDNYGHVVDAIRNWPLNMQLMLARLILSDFENAIRPRPTRKASRDALERLRGIARTDQPPPSDEEVAQWLDEYRTSKYG